MLFPSRVIALHSPSNHASKQTPSNIGIAILDSGLTSTNNMETKTQKWVTLNSGHVIESIIIGKLGDEKTLGIAGE
jgi:hypothetical protein